jgi:hypothetical protein
MHCECVKCLCFVPLVQKGDISIARNVRSGFLIEVRFRGVCVAPTPCIPSREADRLCSHHGCHCSPAVLHNLLLLLSRPAASRTEDSGVANSNLDL